MLQQLCLAKGFICEICRKVDDVIFPFDLSDVILCSGKLLCLSVLPVYIYCIPTYRYALVYFNRFSMQILFASFRQPATMFM